MSNDGFLEGLAVGIFVTVCFGVIFLFATLAWIRDGWRDDEIRNGKAEYYLDQNNYRQWRWKDG